MSTTFRISRAALIGACVFVLSPAAQAAGFYIQEQSVSGLGAAFSGGVTNLHDASTAYFNPAGLTKLGSAQAQLGVQLLMPKSTMRDTGSTRTALPGPAVVAAGGNNGGNPYDPTPVPNGYISYPVNDDITLGLAVTAPFGLALDYNTGWFGRFDSTKTELTMIDTQPTLAWRANDKLSLGFGINLVHADADLQNIVSNVLSEGTQRLEGDDWGYGYTFGLQYMLTPATTFGANYKSNIHFDLEGRASVSGLTAGNFNRPAEASLVTPDIASFGLAHKLDDKWTIQGQATWFGWNSFNAITPVFTDTNTVGPSVMQNYQTTWAYALGAEYKWSDQWLLRGGVQYDQTPTTDEFRTTRTPDGNRRWIAAGATYSISPRTSLDMGGAYIDVSKENIDVTRGVTAVHANTEGKIGILSLALNYKF